MNSTQEQMYTTKEMINEKTSDPTSRDHNQEFEDKNTENTEIVQENQPSSEDEWSDAECMPILTRKTSYDRELQEELMKTKIMESKTSNCISLFARREILPTSEISDLLPSDFVARSTSDLTIKVSKSIEKLECTTDSVKQEVVEDIIVVKKPAFTIDNISQINRERKETEAKEKEDKEEKDEDEDDDDDDSIGRSRKVKKSNDKKDRNRSKKSSKSPKLKRKTKVIEPYHCNCCGKNVIEIRRRIEK